MVSVARAVSAVGRVAVSFRSCNHGATRWRDHDMDQTHDPSAITLFRKAIDQRRRSLVQPADIAPQRIGLSVRCRTKRHHHLVAD